MLTAVSLCAIAALLRYTGLLAKGGLGVRLMIVAAAFMIVAVGFEALASLVTTYGDETLAEQVSRAGVYMGYSVGGVCAILGGVLIALKSLIGGGE